MFSRELVINNGRKFELPIFLPVYQPHRMQALRSAWSEGPEIEGCIVNSYFLYKQRELRQQLVEGPGLHDYLGFDGLVTTDSGAFQGLTRQLYLNNADIVRFQDRIGSDIVSPLDLITPPGDKKAVAEAKLVSTEKRIVKAMGLVERGILVGVQQGDATPTSADAASSSCATSACGTSPSARWCPSSTATTTCGSSAGPRPRRARSSARTSRCTSTAPVTRWSCPSWSPAA